MNDKPNLPFCSAPVLVPSSGEGRASLEINAKNLSKNGFRHFPCSRERFGKPMAYYLVNPNNTAFIVIFDGSYSVYLLIEPRLLDHLKSYKMIHALILYVRGCSPYYKPCLVIESSYVQYFDFNGFDFPVSESSKSNLVFRDGSWGSFLLYAIKDKDI